MTLPLHLYDWPAELYELWLERAAIMEFEGYMPRFKAQAEAEKDIRKLAEAE